MKKDYFSWQNINELVEIDKHIEFAEKIITEYDWDLKVKQRLYAELKKIKDKQNDDKLNLSVIGEFSTGKSTFINALLRMELLTACVLQGTTTASTIIEYAEDYKITLHNKNGSIKNMHFNSLEALRDCLDKYTTQEKLSKQLKYIYVYLPSPVLALGYRIIDTPGTNSLERWHEEVTVRTIREMADASVILSSMEQLLSQNTVNFVNNNLSDILNQCIFVGTKFDLIRKRERDRMLVYMYGRISQEFGLPQPMAYPYASLDVLDDFYGHKPEDASLVKISHDTEKQMFSYLAKHRSVAQAKKLVALITQMYDYISQQIIDTSNAYSSELEELLLSRQEDIARFVKNQTEIRLDSFRRNIKDELMTIGDNLYDFVENGTAEIINNIEGNTKEQIRDYVNNSLTVCCEEKAKAMLKKVNVGSKAMTKLYKNNINLFQQSFEEGFSDLEILDVKVKSKLIKINEISVEQGKLAEAMDYMKKEISAENILAFGGMATGAAIGTAILPGIGTIVGGFLGLVAGVSASGDVEEYRKNVQQKIEAPVKNYLNEIYHMAIREINLYSGELEDLLVAEINEYEKAYKSIVDKRIEEQKLTESMLEGKIEKAYRDKQMLENRRFELDSISKQIEKAN